MKSEKSGLGRFKGLLGGRAAAAALASDSGSPARTSSSELSQALNLLRDFEASGIGWFWSTDAEGKINYITEGVAKRLGQSREDILGLPLSAIFTIERDEQDDVQRTLPLILSARKTFSELAIRPAIEDEIWWAISGRPQFNDAGDFLGYNGNGADVTATFLSQRDASRLAMFDSLTGLANRNRMNKRLHTTLVAYKSAQRACALMMLDLDRFKQVNDTLGHPAGDELLRQVAQRLTRIMPDGCEIGRLGGDEFQVILPDIDDRGRLGDIAKKIIEMISQPYSIDGSRCTIGASVGIAVAPYDGIDSEEITRNADLALYASKEGGRGQFRFYSHDLHTEAERRRQIEEDLRDALVKDQLRLAYQPILDLATNKVIGLEAMMRWEHPELGNVPPEVFIPVAEDTNLIGTMGDWALRQACSDAVQLPGNVSIAVNISAMQFGNLGFPSVVAQALSASGLDPERLELEVTESIFLADELAVEQMFKTIKLLGVRLSLDDFGTGYSALGYLKKADFDKIKIDQGFIRGVTEKGSRNQAIIRSIVSLAHGLNMTVVAEGIEAHDELAVMHKLGVHQIQGFIYAHPVGFDDVMEAMTTGEWFIEPHGPSKYRNERMTMLRKIGLIHEDHRYDATMRNLSRTGCMVEGLADVPVGAQFVVDFGEGQLSVATVRRSMGSMMGLEFEMPMVDDGAGGLCTRNRISPYVLATAGMPLAALPSGNYPLGPGGMNSAMPMTLPKFAQANDSGRRALRAG